MASMVPEISVITPVYNPGDYFAPCLTSLEAQTIFDQIEVVLVDDGSTDGSGDLCDEFAAKHGNARVIHQEHHGVAAARNIGLDAALGEWIAFVDADDVIGSAYLHTLHEAAVEHGVDIAISKVVHFAGAAPHCLSGTSSDTRLENGREICRINYTSKAKGFVFDALWGKVCKRSLFDAIRFPPGKTREDAFVAHELIYPQERVALCTGCFYGYRDNPAGIMSSSTGKEYFDAMDALEARISYYERAGDGELAETTRGVSDLWRAMHIAEIILDGTEAQIPDRWRMGFGEILDVLGKHVGAPEVRPLLAELLERVVRARGGTSQ